MTSDLYANTGDHLYLRLSGTHYRRDNGKGWVRVEESTLPATIRWAALQPPQRAVYKPVLRAAGLLQ